MAGIGYETHFVSFKVVLQPSASAKSDQGRSDEDRSCDRVQRPIKVVNSIFLINCLCL